MALDPRLKLAFVPGAIFKDNIQRLEEHRRITCSKTKTKLIKLTNKALQTRVIRAEQGSFASVFFLEWLSLGTYKFTIDEERHEVVKKFFGPIWNEPGHPTIDFLRESGVVVERFEEVRDNST
jgi:hypothetical protein